mgnify:CR=1 FL=1
MFRKSFVACLKVQGQILRESEDTVRLPFGAEYAVFLRNYQSRRAVVRVEIDGQDVLDGRRLVVEPNSSLELERFLKDGDLHKGNRFRFIHKTEKIQAHRGDRVDDGIVRISWQYEQPTQQIITKTIHHIYHDRAYRPETYPGGHLWYFVDSGGANTGGATSDSATYTSYNATSNDVREMSVPCNATASAVPLATHYTPAPNADEGITVAGSHSTQTFQATYVGTLDPEVHVITLRLLGESPITGQVVEKPVTVKEKLQCPTCGTDNTSKHHYCGECGTCLGD